MLASGRLVRRVLDGRAVESELFIGGPDPPEVVLRGPTGRPRASAVDLDALALPRRRV